MPHRHMPMHSHVVLRRKVYVALMKDFPAADEEHFTEQVTLTGPPSRLPGESPQQTAKSRQQRAI